MGGLGSTRWRGHRRRRTVDEVLAFPVSVLASYARHFPTPPGPGRRSAELRASAAWGLVHASVTVEAAAQPFGGVRWWWRCGGCDRRRRALYAVQAHCVVRCRVCLGLAYSSQQLAPLDRLAHRAYGLALRLGATEFIPAPHARPPARPAGMHRRTYRARRAQLDMVLADRRALWMARAMVLLDRIDPNWREDQ